MPLRILYQDDHYVAIDKPAGFQVHPPEDPTHTISNSINCLYLLRNQLKQYLYPVHRLDRATSGVLLFALKSESASALCRLFQDQKIQKVYYAVARGWTQAEGQIEHSLSPKGTHHCNTTQLFSVTYYQRLEKLSLPIAIHKYSTSRFSLVRVIPRTGKKHQIRKHFSSSAHPLIGDTIYGDGKQNRIFRDHFGISNLLLKAYSIRFTHPFTHQSIKITSRWNKPWHQIFELFKICPFEEIEILKN